MAQLEAIGTFALRGLGAATTTSHLEAGAAPRGEHVRVQRRQALDQERLDHGRDRRSDTIAGLAKFHNTRTAREVITLARDMLGGNGVLLENHVIRHMGDIEVIHTYEGTETMQALIVGRDITGLGAFT